jgi:hypothetical protein
MKHIRMTRVTLDDGTTVEMSPMALAAHKQRTTDARTEERRRALDAIASAQTPRVKSTADLVEIIRQYYADQETR